MSVPRTYLTRSVIAALAVCTGLVLAGCGGSGAAPGSPSGATGSSSAGALPIEQRVIDGNLAGLTSPQGVQMATTPDDYAKLVNPDDPDDPDLADKRTQDAARAKENGFVKAAVKNYGTTDAGWGVSVAAQLGSPDQAKAYEQKFYDEQYGNDLPPGAQKGTIAGSPSSHTLIASAEDEGQKNTLVLASFVDGPFVYVLSAGGVDPTVTGDQAKQVIDQANQLYAKVKDRPAA